MTILQAATIVTLLALGFGSGWTVQGWRKDEAIASLHSEHDRANRQAALTALVKTQELQDTADATSKKLRAQLAARDRDLSAVLVRLRDYKPAELLPPDLSATTECVGARERFAEFYRARVEGIAALAREADKSADGLKACVEQYNAIREAVNR